MDDHWGIGSLSKTFIATLILQYVDEGLLDLDATVPELLPPDVLNTSQAYGDVTLYQLLSMTSGVPDFFNDPDGLLADVFSDPEQAFTAQDIVDAAVATGPPEPPGTSAYSSTNYVVFQAIAEHLGGKPTNDLYKERIYGPLGTDTVLPPSNGNAIVPKPRSEAIMTTQCNKEFIHYGFNSTEEGIFIGDTITEVASTSIGVAGAAGSMWSTLSDMLIWAKSGTGNSLLSDETSAKRLELGELDGGLRQYGMGIHSMYQLPSPEDPSNIFANYWGHSGEAFGYESISGHDAESGGSFFVATTSCGMEFGVNVPLFTSYLKALSAAEEAVANSTATSAAPTSAAPGTEPPNDPGTTSMAGFDLHSSACVITTCVLNFIAMLFSY